MNPWPVDSCSRCHLFPRDPMHRYCRACRRQASREYRSRLPCNGCGGRRAVSASGHVYTKCRGCLNLDDVERKHRRGRGAARPRRAAPRRVRPPAATPRPVRKPMAAPPPEQACSECGAYRRADDVQRVRSRDWTGPMCRRCRALAASWGMEVQPLADEPAGAT